MWVQHSGALPHFGREVTEYLNAKYRGNWWIEQGGLLIWLVKLPGLTLLDFFYEDIKGVQCWQPGNAFSEHVNKTIAVVRY
jgi:hypothetical protein